MGESTDVYFEQLAQYFKAENIYWCDVSQSARISAITNANIEGNAATWWEVNK